MSQNKLKKEINYTMAFALVVGTVIGSGVFFKTGPVLGYTKSAGLGMAAWIIGGILTIMAGLTIAELASAIPRMGGVYAYLDEIYGGTLAFLFGWMQTLIYTPAILAALSILFANQASAFIPMDSSAKLVVALGALIFLITMNAIGTKYGGIFQVTVTAIKLIPIFLIILLGVFRGNIGNFQPLFLIDAGTATGLGAAILSTLWAYDGWATVGNIAGEMKNPVKDLPKAIVIGIGFVMVVYTLINYAYIHVMPINDIIASSAPASAVATILFGKVGGVLISAGILISIFGTLNGFTLTGIRMPFAMAEQGRLPFSKIFGKIDARFKTPVNASILIMALSIIYIFSGSFDRLTDLAMFSTWVFYIITLAGLFKMRKRGITAPYRTPWYPLPTIIAIIGGAYIGLNNVFFKPLDSAYALLLTLVGLPIYWIVKNRKKV